MKKRLIALFLPILTSLLLAGCQIASPMTTMQNFLTALQKEDYLKAVNLVANPETEWPKNTQEKLGKVYKFNVQNAIPLNENALKEINTQEGYEVFYYLESEKKGSQNLKVYVIKQDGNWKILPPLW